MTEPLWQTEDAHGLPLRLDPDGDGVLLHVGRQAASFDLNHPEQRAALDDLLDALVAALGREWSVERLDRDPGDDEQSMTPIRLLDGQAETLVAIEVDGVGVRVVGKSDTFRTLYVREGQ